MEIVKVRWDSYLVQKAVESETALPGGKIQTAEKYREKQRKGQVLKVGRGGILGWLFVFTRRFWAPLYKKGDWCMFGPHAGVPVPDEFGKDLLIVTEDEILAQLK